MRVFIDASAIVAVLGDEAGRAERVREGIGLATHCVSSPLAVWEAAAALDRKARERSIDLSRDEIEETIASFLDMFQTEIFALVPIDREVAFSAWLTFGKGSDSKAKLNMGDCFHYAVAKRLGASILFTSPDEFHYTDLACAVARP